MSEEAPRARLLTRRRRANVAGGRRHEHKVRVSADEEARLVVLAEAQHVSVPRLLVESALAVTPGETVTDRRDAMAELFALHRLLAGIANNVNQLARAANSTAEVPAETGAVLARVRVVADRIDTAIDGLSRP